MHDRRIWIIFTIIFVNLLGFGIILPLMPYYAESLGASTLTIGLLFAAYSLFQFLSAPILGELSDKIGRRPILLFSLLGTVVSFALLGVAHSIPILFLARIVDGLSGGNISTAQAYVADITTKQNRTQGMSILAAAFGLGFILGPSVGGLLSRFGYAVPAFVAAAIAFISLVLTYFYLPETSNKQTSSKKRKLYFSLTDFIDALTHPKVGSVMTVYFLLMLAFASMQGTFALFAEHTLSLKADTIGLLFGYLGVIGIIIQLFLLKKLTSRFNEGFLAIVGVSIMAIAFGLMTFARDIAHLIIAITGLAVGNSITNPVLTGLVSKLSDQEEQGSALGMFQSLASIGRLIGPVAGTFLFSTYGAQAPFFAGSLLLVGAAGIGFRSLRKTKTNT